jgi:hypothetical protein
MRPTHRATRKTSLLDDAHYGVPEEGVAAFVEAPAKTDRHQDKWSTPPRGSTGENKPRNLQDL